MEVELDIDPTVKPVKQPQRPIAFHLRDAVGREIIKQVEVEEGILEPVNASS